MALTTPSRSMALASLALAAASGGGADGTGMPVEFARPCPLSRMNAHQMDVHRSCSADVADLCVRPRSGGDDLDALFGRFLGSPFEGGPFGSDPFFRSPFENDPFLRMVATPPGMTSSPSLLDEFFGGMQREQQQQVERREVQQVDPIAAMLDDMLDSAVRFAFSPPGGSVRVTRIGPGWEEEQAQAEEAQVEEEAQEEPAEEAVQEQQQAADPADVAEAALERMVNSLLGHAVSASASARSAGSADGDEDEDGHPLSPRIVDGEVQREVVSRESASGDEDEEVDPIDVAYGGMVDPVSIARQISEHGEALLGAEEAEPAEAGEEDEPDLRRRRLTEEHPDVRRRLARRLTEVAPIAGMPVRIRLVSLGDTDGVRFFVNGEEDDRRVQEQQQQPVRPSLMLGPGVDLCLWDMYDAGKVSEGCGSSLARARAAFSEFRRQDERREREAAMVAAAAMRNFLHSEPREEVPYGSVWENLSSTQFLLIGLWCVFFVLSLHACCCEEDDEEDDEYYYDPQDYVALCDEDGDEVERQEHPEVAVGYPAARNAARVRSEKRQGVAFVAVPIQVV